MRSVSSSMLGSCLASVALLLSPLRVAAQSPATPTPKPAATPTAAQKAFAALTPAEQQAAIAAYIKSKKPAASPAPKVAAKPGGTPKPAAPPATPAPGQFIAGDPSQLPVLGKPGPGTKAVQEPNVRSWLEHNVEIRNSLYDSKDADSPAKMSWNRNKGESPFYTIDGAFALTSFFQHPPHFSLLNQDVFWTALPLVEAHVSNETNTPTKHNTRDSIMYALPLTFTYGTAAPDQQFTDWLNGPVVNVPGSKYQTPDWIEGGEFIVNPAYRTDLDNHIKAFEGGVYWKPGVWHQIGLNVRVTLIPNFLTFRWDPMIGLESGEYQHGSNVTISVPQDYVRGIFRVHGELGIGPGFQQPFAITADYTIRHEFAGSSADYNYSQITVLYHVDPDRAAPVADANNMPVSKDGKPVYVNIPGHVTVGATWQRGKDAPTFKDVDTFTGWVGLQF